MVGPVVGASAPGPAGSVVLLGPSPTVSRVVMTGTRSDPDSRRLITGIGGTAPLRLATAARLTAGILVALQHIPGVRPARGKQVARMEWNGNGMEWTNGMEWREWNGME